VATGVTQAPNDKQQVQPMIQVLQQQAPRLDGRLIPYAKPVLGIIKSVLGFRQFSLRGLRKVTGEWNLVCLAWPGMSSAWPYYVQELDKGRKWRENPENLGNLTRSACYLSKLGIGQIFGFESPTGC
jgi:hypothetical protein